MSSSNHSSVTVSVIIPAYNSERGVAKAVESLQKQTIDENALEIILVNDGSTDSTSAICHELAGKASNIVVIDKENGGVGSARNAGIEAARGKYIAFLDSDDTAPGMVDQQTTIYGHHMNDGSMFNVISDTTDQATFDSMEYVYYITRDATYKLRPLATKVVEDTYAKARTPNFEGDDGLKNYLSEMLDGASAVASDAADRAASTTKVVTLVTCRSLSFSNTRAVMVLTPVEE